MNYNDYNGNAGLQIPPSTHTHRQATCTPLRTNKFVRVNGTTQPARQTACLSSTNRTVSKQFALGEESCFHPRAVHQHLYYKDQHVRLAGLLPKPWLCSLQLKLCLGAGTGVCIPLLVSSTFPLHGSRSETKYNYPLAWQPFVALLWQNQGNSACCSLPLLCVH